MTDLAVLRTPRGLVTPSRRGIADRRASGNSSNSKHRKRRPDLRQALLGLIVVLISGRNVTASRRVQDQPAQGPAGRGQG